MGGRFTEDPDLEAALSGGGGFQEDPDLEAALGGSQARSTASPQGGSVAIAAPPEGIPPQPEEQPWYSKMVGDAVTPLRSGYEWLNNKLGPSPEERQRQLDEATAAGTRGFADPGILRRQLGADVITGLSAAPGGGFAANAVKGAVAGAAQGYVPGADPRDAAIAAGLGGVLGGVSGLAGNGSRASGALANEQRMLSAGFGADELERMGPQAVAQQARQMEAAGLHQGPLGGMLPAGPKSIYRNAQAMADRSGASMRDAEDQLVGLPQQPRVQVGGLIADQRARAAADLKLADPGNQGPAAFRREMASNLANDTIQPGQGPRIIDQSGWNLPDDFHRTLADAAQSAKRRLSGWNGHEYKVPGRAIDVPSDELAFDRALQQRRDIDSKIRWGALPGAETGVNEVRKDVAGGLRGAIDTSLDDPSVPTDLAQQWRQGRDQFSFASSIGDPALKALGRSNGPGLPVTGTQAMGLASRTGGHSLLAGTGRAVESTLGATESAAKLGSLTSGPQAQALQQALDPNRAIGEGRGNLKGQAAEKLLQTNPQAFGRWQPQIAQAVQDGTINQLIIKLGRDPDFRMGPGMQLQQMTAQGQ